MSAQYHIRTMDTEVDFNNFAKSRKRRLGRFDGQSMSKYRLEK